MITMKIKRFDRNNDNTPILSNNEIDEFAYAVLEDYKPQLLREPGAVSFEHFLESYLGMAIMYNDIFYEEDTPPIYGRTVFRRGPVKMFDHENNCVAYPLIEKNTVIIDNFVTDKEGMAKFTGLHEGGHILMHQGVYSIFKLGQTCCRRGYIENTGDSQLLRTSEQWLEHQADYFAAALAMPNVTFIPFVNDYLRENGVWKRNIVVGEDDDLDILVKDLLPERIAEVYVVSKQSARIKLRKSGFVIGGQSN